MSFTEEEVQAEIDRLAGNQERRAQGKPIVQHQFSEEQIEAELRKLSGEEPEGPGIGEQILGGVVKVGQAVDSVTGAPTRASIRAAQEGDNPFSAFASQFAEDPSKAPTGKDIALEAGVSDEATFSPTSRGQLLRASRGQEPKPGLSSADVAGFGLDVTSDVSNIVPGVAAVKQLGRGAKALGGGLKVGGELTVQGVGTLLKKSEFLENTLKIAKGTAEQATALLNRTFNPKLSEDLPRFKQILERNEITAPVPKSIEFGDDTLITNLERVNAERGFSPEVKEIHNNFIQEVNGAANKKVSEIAGGLPVDAESAGQTLRVGFEEGVAREFKNIESSYDSVLQDIIGKTGDAPKIPVEVLNKHLVPVINEITSKSRKLEKFTGGGFKDVTAQIDRMDEIISKTLELGDSLEDQVDYLKFLGDHAFKGKTFLDVPADIQQVRKLYFGLRDTIIDSTRFHLGDEVADTLQNSNEIVSELINDKGLINQVLKNKNTSDGDIFRKLILGGDTKKIEAVRKFLTPEQFDQMKGAFLENIVSKNADDLLNFRTTRSKLKNKKHLENMSHLFLDDPRLTEYLELAEVGDAAGSSILNTSRTSVSGALGKIKESTVDAISNKSVIEVLEGRAKKTNRPGKEIIKDIKNTPIKFRRNKIENILKGAQTISIQQGESAIQRRIQNNEERNK